MPSSAQKPAPSRVGAIIAAAVLVAAPIAERWEGVRIKPYYDPAHILTVCHGETEYIELRIYSKEECAAMLRKRLADDYAPRIAACLPEVATWERVKVFGALLDASYNAGWAGVCNSRMARLIRAGQWTAACKALDGWYVTAKNRKTGVRVKLRGLVLRRQDEMRVCLQAP
jgi:lysozyme